MQQPILYCPNCKEHTPHRQLVTMYAAQCTICHVQTSGLERSHTENLTYTAPDGTQARVVHNTPETVTFFVPTGQYQGYYHYEKATGKKRIDQRKITE